MTTEIIHPGGDIIVSAGPADGLFHFQVSSVILCSASPVFKAMYSTSRFSEGNDLQLTGLSAMRLEKDINTVRSVLRCLHHQFDTATATSIGTQEGLDMAVLADKYNCIRTISIAMRESCEVFIRCEPQSEDKDVPGWVRILTISYLANMLDLFKSSSKVLCQEVLGDYQEIFEEYRPLVPDYVLLWLEVSRERLTSMYQSWLMDLILPMSMCSYTEEHHRVLMDIHAQLRRSPESVKLWMPKDYQAVYDKICKKVATTHGFYCEGCDVYTEEWKYIDNEDIKTAQSWHGLCLRCCIRREGDPYLCDGSCEDPRRENQEDMDIQETGQNEES
ncbi:Hypothetical protein D9617_13g100430 [Elsinoe fawcettii]|nr:Hypothetical protein D9617_13g100430 [Elsinoe fawcettii]